MDKTFSHPVIKSRIRAISSKSEAHRALICAAISDSKTHIICTDTNADIDATGECLNALGATVVRTGDGFDVTPIKKSAQKNHADLPCNESGSTLRFLLPLAASLGADCSFHMRGRLQERPLSPLYELLAENGVSLSPQGKNPLCISGNLTAGDYAVKADISSQYISGLLFALSIADGDSSLKLEGNIESAPYIWMTVDTLRLFGADISFNEKENKFYIKGVCSLASPGEITIGGDWSNAAFFLCAGAIGKTPAALMGLDKNSRQGDSALLDILSRMGAGFEWGENAITVYPSPLRATDIDASQIPDLVPILSLAASVADGETRIYNAARLRLKESDRIESVCKTLSALGADIRATADGMVIKGKKELLGGSVDSFNDHRIAMTAAIASLVCKNEVKISNFQAINKSYPAFCDAFENI